MKLLHISDWHIGRVTYSEPRAADHEAVLDEILALAREIRPDVIVHTGDLFDVVRPAYTDMARATDALQALGGVAPVVVLCGNHDSPALFALFSQLVGPDSRVRYVDKVRAPADGGVLHLPTATGDVVRLALMPFVHQNRMVEAFEDPARWMGDYTDRVHTIETLLGRALAAGFDNRRDIAVFAAHLHVGGAHFSGSEKSIHITDTYASHVDHLPPVSYAAFGHIHRPQPLPGGTVNGRYAGSPIPLDFGEVGETKQVVYVEAEPGRPARISPIDLSGGRALCKLDGTIEELQVKAGAVGNSLCLVTVRTETPATALSEQVRAMLPDAVILQVTEVCAAHQVTPLTRADATVDVEPDFDELFRDYLSEQGTKGAEADRVAHAFATLLRAVEAEEPAGFPDIEVLAETVGPTEQ